MKPRRLATYFLVVGWLSLCLGAVAHSQAHPLCTQTDYRIVSFGLIAVQCDEDVSQLTGEGQLLDPTSGPGKPLVSSIPITPYEGASQWLILDLTAGNPAVPAGPLQMGKKYTLALTLHHVGGAAPSGTPTAFNPSSMRLRSMGASRSRSFARTMMYSSWLVLTATPSGPSKRRLSQ